MYETNETIYLNQLSKFMALGSYEKNFYYIIVFMIIVIIYLFIYPLIKWFITLQSARLLSYILCSFIVLFILFLAVQALHDMEKLFFQTMKMVCQCLAVFGITLIVYHGFQKVKRKI